MGFSAPIFESLKMPAPTSREYRIYLAIWRKALLSPNMVEIKCSTRNMAIAMRQGMYRAIRPFRDGRQVDEDLRLAADKFVVYLNNDNNSLELRERLTLTELDGLFDELGITEPDLLLGEERVMVKNLEEFIETEGAATRKTAFYERD